MHSSHENNCSPLGVGKEEILNLNAKSSFPMAHEATQVFLSLQRIAIDW